MEVFYPQLFEMSVFDQFQLFSDLETLNDNS